MSFCNEKIKYLMHKIGLRQTIPASYINKVTINENNEPLVNLRNEAKLFFSNELMKQEKIFLRQSVAEKLKLVAKSLPTGVNLKIYSAYRSSELQIQMWQKRLKINRLKYPLLSDKEIEIKTKAQIADPTKGFGGHQTGGAVDVTLCDDRGKDLDMGTKISEHSHQTPTKASDLSKIQKKNRTILYKAMISQGFKNYPAEWWHFSFGDRLWAAYSNKNQCLYGYIEGKEGQR